MELFETQRTIVRHFRASDFADLHEILGDPIVMENLEPVYDEEKSARFLEGFCISEKRGLAVVLKTDNKVIGYILFSDRLEKDVYEIGWIFNKNYWRKGLAYESMRGLVNYAFTQKNAHKLFAEAIDEKKSVGLMQKLGMIHEGTQRQQVRDNFGIWKDLFLYGLLKEDNKDH